MIKKNRKDAKLEHVIISEKKDTVIDKYKNNTIPIQFKTRNAYEQSLRNPLGKDWNTCHIQSHDHEK